MVVGELAESADLVVIGGGPGGYVAAAHAAELGREVTLVERGGPERLGGECLHAGCIPSKALIELAATITRLHSLSGRGLKAAGVAIDLNDFQAWKRELTAGLAAGIRRMLESKGVRILTGSARFNGPDRIVVAAGEGAPSFLEFRQAIVATGSRPIELPGLPVDGAFLRDSAAALELDRVPERLAVVGGGYIGMELGMALAKLGSSVIVVEALDRVLGEIDEALSRPVLREATVRGIQLLPGTRAVGASAEQRLLHVTGPDGERAIEADCVIIAVGRRPNTDDLGLEHVGVRPGPDGLIQVGADRRATDRIAAIGDVVPGPALAHKASAEARVAVEALCGRSVAFEPEAIPAVFFTDPEVATVGLTAAQARAAGMDAVAATYPLTASGRAATLATTEGSATVVADRATNRIVGVHIVGPHASELISAGSLAIEMITSPEDLTATIHPHPTLSEAIAHAAQRLPQRR